MDKQDFITITDNKTSAMQPPPAAASSPYTNDPIPHVKSWDFRIGRDFDGKWWLGRNQHETQEEMLSELQDTLDELFGPEEYDMKGDPRGIFHVPRPA